MKYRVTLEGRDIADAAYHKAYDAYAKYKAKVLR